MSSLAVLSFSSRIKRHVFIEVGRRQLVVVHGRKQRIQQAHHEGGGPAMSLLRAISLGHQHRPHHQVLRASPGRLGLCGLLHGGANPLADAEAEVVRLGPRVSDMAQARDHRLAAFHLLQELLIREIQDTTALRHGQLRLDKFG